MGKAPANIEQQLRQAILDSDLSRYELAKRTGVSQATLSLFVHGHRSVTMGLAAKLAAELGLELTRTRKGR